MDINKKAQPKVNKKEIETQDFVAEHYEKVRYSKKYSLRYHKWWDTEMIRLVKPDGMILDNGCGQGHFAENYLKGQNVIGLDISSKMLKYAKNRMDKVVLGDSQQLPFKDNCFDTMFARGLLHHLPDPGLGIAEIQRTLKDDGQVIFVDPIATFISTLPRKIQNKKSDHFSEEHKNFRRNEIITLIENHLKIEKIRPFGYIAYPLLGFPDVLDVYRFVPLKKLCTPLLMGIDKIISHTPFIKNQAWGVFILASKNNSN